MSSILPDVGTVYSSLPAFKLDLYERGLQNSLHLVIQQSSPDKKCYIHCGNRIGNDKKFCTYRCWARNVEGVIQVTTVWRSHSCRGFDTEAKRLQARAHMKALVDKARSELANWEESEESDDEERKGSPGASEMEAEDGVQGQEVVADEYVEVEFGSSEEVEEEDKGTEHSASPAARGRRRVTQDALSTFRKTFPSARDVQTESDKLKLSDVVDLPSPETTFDSVRQLLIVLYAFAQQRKFTVSRRSPEPRDGIRNTMIMRCHRGTYRFKHGPNGGRCTYQLYASKGPDGKWRLDTVVGSHNHDVLRLGKDLSVAAGSGAVSTGSTHDDSQPAFASPLLATSSSITPSTRQRLGISMQAGHPSTQDATFDASGQRFTQTLSTSTQFQPFALPATLPISSFYSASSSSAVAPITRLSTQTLPSLDPIPSTYPPDLVSFLRSFRSSPTNFPHLLNKLHNSGVDSLETLLEILMMEDESLENFIGMLDDQEVGIKLLEMVQEMRSENGLA